MSFLKSSAETKVRELDVPASIKQNVVWLDIPAERGDADTVQLQAVLTCV